MLKLYGRGLFHVINSMFQTLKLFGTSLGVAAVSILESLSAFSGFTKLP